MKAYLLLLAVLILSALLIFRSFEKKAAPNQTSAPCPMIAKACPDGSYVWAKRPKCEIPACPTAKPITR